MRRPLALLFLLSAACATGGKIRASAEVVKGDLKKAEASNATRLGCAPREYALAEANVDFALTELERGNSVRAQQHISIAIDNAAKALRLSAACAPKQVLVRQAAPPPQPIVVKLTPTDRDGDGINDVDDKCPDDPEDMDAFQDQDGCPEPDNDGDGVLDGSDRCMNDPGPVENGGCPDEDSDSDTLVNRLDRCPMDPGPPDNGGCPKIWRDSDSDGIGDENDRCPVDPEDRDGFEDDDGCPDTDNDKDGLVDKVDLCPNQPGPLETRGCPDADSDGIADPLDKCPAEPEDKDNFEDQDGCPDLDNDKDGLADGRDKCPNEAGPVENNGCPDLDQDGDRIVDRLDKCPTEFGVPEEQGCPKKYSLIVVKRDVIEIKQQVHFATNKDTILPDSFELLNQISSVFKDNPTMKVRVEGHTDNVGDDSRNLRLSQRRADSVKKYIGAQGVEVARMDAIGFGETRPIASNSTAKGKALNRRVEFHIIER